MEALVAGILRTYGSAFSGRTASAPLRRIGEPEEIGPIAAFLASRTVRFITGQVIVANGGVTIG